jgi:hypothetical protein
VRSGFPIRRTTKQKLRAYPREDGVHEENMQGFANDAAMVCNLHGDEPTARQGHSIENRQQK